MDDRNVNLELAQLRRACLTQHREALRSLLSQPSRFNNPEADAEEKEAFEVHVVQCNSADLDALRYCANLLRTSIADAAGRGQRKRRIRTLRAPYLEYVHGAARIRFSVDLNAEVAA